MKEVIYNKCPVCGKEFQGRHNKIYCSNVCGQKARTRRKAGKMLNDLIRIETSYQRISRVAREARDHGMSFGKYLAFLEVQQSKSVIGG